MYCWNQWLYDHHFITIETDHKPLETIFKNPIAQAPTPLPKMLLKLQRYSFNVIYPKVSTMCLADTLSRARIPRIAEAKVSPLEVFMTALETTNQYAWENHGSHFRVDQMGHLRADNPLSKALR